MPGVCVRAVPACGVRRCGVGARRESGYLYACGEAVPGTAGGRRTLGGLPSSDANTRARCAGGHVAGWATLCLRAVRGRTCVGAWAGTASGGYFGAFALVAVWVVLRLLHAGRILCRKVHNNAYSQDSQEFGASAGAY